ncbi:MAG: hypothetical protein AB7W16_22895 [Candidatus Obscuribacterales bacterium]
MNGLANKTKKRRTAVIAVAVALALGGGTLTQAALAGNGQSEVFSARPAPPIQTKPPEDPNLAPATRAGALSIMSDDSPALRWFENYDMQRFTYQKSPADRAVLRRPFNQEAERVKAWTDTAGKVAYNYRELAKLLRASTAPDGHQDIDEFRKLMADWYDDEASVYEELIKPRPPARTREDLDEQLLAVKSRAASLKDNYKALNAMDIELRQKYRVHLNKNEDPLTKYVTGVDEQKK